MKQRLSRLGEPMLRPSFTWRKLAELFNVDGRNYMRRLHPVARWLVVATAVSVVSLTAAWTIKKLNLLGGTSVLSVPTTVTTAERPLIQVNNAGPKWEDVPKMASVAGEWVDPCGVSGPYSSIHGCGTVVHIRSGDAAKEKDLPLSYYSWHLELHPARGEVRYCGFRPQLQLSPDQDPEKAWRIGYCTSKKQPKKKAVRIGLMYQAGTQDVLKVLIGSDTAVLRRTK